MQSEYTFKRKIISDGRITVPKVVLDEWELSHGDEIIVTFRKTTKKVQGIVI